MGRAAKVVGSESFGIVVVVVDDGVVVVVILMVTIGSGLQRLLLFQQWQRRHHQRLCCIGCNGSGFNSRIGGCGYLSFGQRQRRCSHLYDTRELGRLVVS